MDDPRLVEALDDYMALLDAGKRPSRWAFLAKHAVVAESLVDYLPSLELLNNVRSQGPGWKVLSNLPPQSDLK